MKEVWIPAPHGRLEGLLDVGASPSAAVLVCHPHPLMGGTMHQPIAYRVADAFRSLGCTVLRFNFRGVGRSTGAYDEGRGELDDARAALEVLSAEAPGVPLLFAGYSFGAHVGLRLAHAEARLAGALGIGLATTLFDHGFVASLKKPLAVVQGELDELGPVAQVRPLVQAAQAPHRFFEVEGADHFGTGRLSAIASALRDAADWLLEA